MTRKGPSLPNERAEECAVRDRRQGIHVERLAGQEGRESTTLALRRSLVGVNHVARSWTPRHVHSLLKLVR